MLGQSHSTAVIDMLREDHQKVKDLFEQFEQAEDNKEKQHIVETALMERRSMPSWKKDCLSRHPARDRRR